MGPSLHRNIPQNCSLFRGTKKSKQISLFCILGNLLMWVGLGFFWWNVAICRFWTLHLSVSHLFCLVTESVTSLSLVLHGYVIFSQSSIFRPEHCLWNFLLRGSLELLDLFFFKLVPALLAKERNLFSHQEVPSCPLQVLASNFRFSQVYLCSKLQLIICLQVLRLAPFSCLLFM